MKLGVSTYSYGNSGSVYDRIRAAKQTGFDVIEFAGIPVEEGGSVFETADKIAECCRETGIEVGNYTIYADFLKPPGGTLAGEIERLRGEVDVAKRLGCPGMRHDAAGGIRGKTFRSVLGVLAEGCRAVTEYAESLGIRTMVENHGYFCQDSERLEALVEAVGSPNFGVLVDTGNFLCADEDPAEAVARLMPYAFHIHAKDFHVKRGNAPSPGEGWFMSRSGNYLRGAILGHGDAPVYQCLQLIRRSGYDGTVSLEFEGMEPPEEGIRIGFKNMKKWLIQRIDLL